MHIDPVHSESRACLLDRQEAVQFHNAPPPAAITPYLPVAPAGDPQVDSPAWTALSLLSDTANSTSDVIVAMGLDGQPRYVSPSAAEMTGYSPEELMSGLTPDLVHPADQPRLLASLRGLAGGEKTLPTFRIRRRDGRYVWIETSFNVAQDSATGEPMEIIAICRDITARKHAETVSDVMEASPYAMVTV
jgi:PAS domain S-box-containing protein